MRGAEGEGGSNLWRPRIMTGGAPSCAAREINRGAQKNKMLEDDVTPRDGARIHEASTTNLEQMRKSLNDCPDGLLPRSQELWAALAPRRAKSVGRKALLEEALRSRDRGDEFRRLITQQGLVTVTERSKVAHLNPLVRAEREARGTFAKIMGLLHLEWDHEIDA
jgi:hypothetical protein